MDNKIKVLHIVPDMAYGGVEKIVLNYYEQLDHNKFTFDYVTHGGVEEYHQSLIDGGSKIYYFKTIGRLGYIKYKEQVKNSINLTEYDIVHIHTGHLTGLYASVFKKLKAKRIICHAHTTKCVNSSHKLMMPFFRFLSVYCSDELMTCGEDAGRFCFGKSAFHLLTNGIDFDLYSKVSVDDVCNLKKALGIKEDSFVIGNVAHFSTQKNHKFIAKLVKEYTKVFPNAVFVLVGDGPLKPEIESSVKENNNVIFTGVRSDIPVLMKAFDVFILPSLFEGLPVVSIEAQAAGTPCLISATVDQRLNINAGYVRFLDINSGCDAWIDALEYIRNDTSLRVSDDKIYKALTESGYEVKTSAKHLEKVYDLLMEKV